MPKDKIAASGSVSRRYRCFCGREFSGVINEVNPKIARHAKYCDQLSDEQRQRVLSDAGMKVSTRMIRGNTKALPGMAGFSDFLPRMHDPTFAEFDNQPGHVGQAAAAAVAAPVEVSEDRDAALAALIQEIAMEEEAKKKKASVGKSKRR